MTETALFDLLKQERTAILTGEFKTIDDLAAQKERLFDDFMRTKPDAEKLPALQAILGRNQVLLKAAIEGVESARTRLLAIRGVREELRVYDQTGEFKAVSAAQPSLSKRS